VDRDLGSLHNHDGESWIALPGAASGEDVLVDAVRAGQKALGGRLVAAYALGSLAHGGFSPLVSDVDVALILADPMRPFDKLLLRGASKMARLGGSALHSRISIFWGTPNSLAGRAVGGRFPPLDRLCLIEHGLLLSGTDIRTGLPRPEPTNLLVSGAQFALDVIAADVLAQAHRPELLVAAGLRWTTKIVLFPVRFLFTAETGREGTNETAAAHYLVRAKSPGGALVAAAQSWRTEPPARDNALTMLRAGLLPLYLHYLDDYGRRLEACGAAQLAQAFRDWRSRLLVNAHRGGDGSTMPTGAYKD
jgi:hypothetical protein